MDNFLIVSPELIARGQVTREQLTNLIYKAGKACGRWRRCGSTAS